MLNHEKLKKDPQIIAKIKLFKSKYNLEAIDYQLEKYGWTQFEKNNVTTYLNI